MCTLCPFGVSSEYLCIDMCERLCTDMRMGMHTHVHGHVCRRTTARPCSQPAMPPHAVVPPTACSPQSTHRDSCRAVLCRVVQHRTAPCVRACIHACGRLCVRLWHTCFCVHAHAMSCHDMSSHAMPRRACHAAPRRAASFSAQRQVTGQAVPCRVEHACVLPPQTFAGQVGQVRWMPGPLHRYCMTGATGAKHPQRWAQAAEAAAMRQPTY